MKKHTITELNQLYQDSKSADREACAEFRSNVLLTAGEHYTKKFNKAVERLREGGIINENQKIRITKNHTQKIVRYYDAAINSFAPGIAIVPNNENEIQDQKDAELNAAVWKFAYNKHKLKKFLAKRRKDFVSIGETAVKIFFDPNKGEVIGYRPKMEDGVELVDENGQPVPDLTQPVHKGDFVFENIYAFNMFRDAGSTSMEESPFWGIEKMVKTKELLGLYQNDEEKKKFISSSEKEAFVVFDSQTANYTKKKDETLVLEYYFRPCQKYPKGYFYIATEHGILEEGELPEGIWPIVWCGFDEQPTRARATSIVKVARPFQAEINRASSQMVQAQITTGDDKILYQQGTKLSAGALLPGVRGVQYQGTPPTILSGRDGGQFAEYVGSQISEMYNVCNLEEEMQEKPDMGADAYATLFKAVKQKKKFSEYGEKWEDFLKEFTYLFLELARYYLPDDELIASIGRKEFINIQEFKKTGPLSYQIKVEAKDDTLESMFGKQLAINHTLQYAGKTLEREDVGKLMRAMPFANLEESFEDITLDYDNAKNDMLMLERGQMPPINRYDDHSYIIRKLTSRKRHSDFRLLPPEIQAMYDEVIAQHEQMEAQLMQEKAALDSEFIPTGGALVGVDMYVVDPANPDSTKRARLPYQAVDWLIKTLEAQGSSLAMLEQANPGVVGDISREVGAMGQQNIYQQNLMSGGPSTPSV